MQDSESWREKVARIIVNLLPSEMRDNWDVAEHAADQIAALSPAPEGWQAENAALRAQIADMQADHNETWGGKVAVSAEVLERLREALTYYAFPTIVGERARSALQALEAKS